MRRIEKGPEPDGLAARRRARARLNRPARAGDWELLGDLAGEVRAALVREQGGLCACCTNRLVMEPAVRHNAPVDEGAQHPRGGPMIGMKIEHFEARAWNADRSHLGRQACRLTPPSWPSTSSGSSGRMARRRP